MAMEPGEDLTEFALRGGNSVSERAGLRVKITEEIIINTMMKSRSNDYGTQRSLLAGTGFG